MCHCLLASSAVNLLKITACKQAVAHKATFNIIFYTFSIIPVISAQKLQNHSATFVGYHEGLQCCLGKNFVAD